MAAAKEQVPSLVTYVEGDATAPQGEGLKIIAHCCNDQNLWGSGFVLALSKRWSRPETVYHQWLSKRAGKDLLGATQLVPVEDDIMVANIIGQHGVGRRGTGGSPPIRYSAISKGFGYIAQFAVNHPERKVSVHMPRLGCDRAGGSWSEIEPLLDQHFVSYGIPVTVYDLPT